MNILGVAIGPQLARPFLKHHYDATTNDTVTVTLPTPSADAGLDPIQILYLIMAALDVATAIVCMITCACYSHCTSVADLFFREADDSLDDVRLIPGDSDSSTNGDGQPTNTDIQMKSLEPCSRIGCILLTLIFFEFFINAGRDLQLTGLLFTYLYEYLGWSVYAGTLLATVFHLVRFVIGTTVVPVSRWVTPTQLAVFDLAALFISSVLMLIALVVEVGGDVYTTLGVIVAAVGDSNIHPTLITLVEETIPVIAPVMALFFSAYGLSFIVIGPIAGTLLYVDVISFPLMLVAVSVVGVVLFVLYLITLRWVKSSGLYKQ